MNMTHMQAHAYAHIYIEGIAHPLGERYKKSELKGWPKWTG